MQHLGGTKSTHLNLIFFLHQLVNIFLLLKICIAPSNSSQLQLISMKDFQKKILACL